MFVVADTSVWIEHLRGNSYELTELLSSLRVLTHSVVIGELSCGNLPRRLQFLNDLELLPKVQEASANEVRACIEAKKLYGRGIGWSDAQLIASALMAGVDFITRDKRLAEVWSDLH